MEIREYVEQYQNNGGYIKTLRKSIGHAPILTIGVGVIIENSKGEVLLQKRKDNGNGVLLVAEWSWGRAWKRLSEEKQRKKPALN